MQKVTLRYLIVAIAAVFSSAGQAQAADSGWNPATLAQLHQWVEAAPDDALPRLDTSALDAAARAGNPEATDRAANALALRLARMHLLGVAGASQRTGWRIADTDDAKGLDARLANALAGGRLDLFFGGLNPQHPDYTALRAAYASEQDPDKRAVYARNMERWRWMPQVLGSDYLLVNAASFEASRWRQGQRVGTWRVIVGKPKTTTPIFAATITGVTINPWWDVPASIVRESVGALVRRHPSLARQRGYVWGGGKIRQRPGPTNSLGQMKLVMPNPYHVYLHDTPNRDLFERDVRAFSHGCIRVGDALGLAAELLEGAKTRAEIDALVAQGETVTLDLPLHLPVYVTYFTAGTRGDGSLAIFPDIYKRDSRIVTTAGPQPLCSA